MGPDLTVYVKPVTEEEMVQEGAQGWAAPVEVEVKDGRLIVVRVVVPNGHGRGGHDGRVEGMVKELGGDAERQLAYEVGEWIRAGPFGVQGRGGVAKGDREDVPVPQGEYEYGGNRGYGW